MDKKNLFFPAFLQTLTDMTGLDVLAGIAEWLKAIPLDERDLTTEISLSRRGRRDAFVITLLRGGVTLPAALSSYDLLHDGPGDCALPEAAARRFVQAILQGYYPGGHHPDHAEWARNRLYRRTLLATAFNYFVELGHAIAREQGNSRERRATHAPDLTMGFQYLYRSAGPETEAGAYLDVEEWWDATGSVEGMLAVIEAFAQLDEEARGFAILAAIRCHGVREFNDNEFRQILRAIAKNYERLD